ncbi:uncharacterized protein LOC27206899 isoform X2 [Drosophila simulans]|uniref:uncharacterized protein LOC27206899 isoform X2 n=1 Tax=Drosophila simulans TaxID=7240 RepID=UPI00192D0FB4|nr:uncharacterized protein LOC27206899 isoform X2 [Drosophila simulans]
MITWPSSATGMPSLVPSPDNSPSQAKPKIQYKTDTLDTQVFREQFLPTAIRQGAELTAVELMRRLNAAWTPACKRAGRRQRAPVYWWNQEIETARRECLSARRRYQRARGAESFAERQSEYRARRKVLKIAIRESKRKCFLDLCDFADSDTWGSAYKVVVKKAYTRTPKLLDPAMLRSVAEHLFPLMDGLHPADPATGDHVETDATISSEEILELAKLLKDGKAPGSDGIPIRALRLALYLQPDSFAKAFTKCLTKEGVFPSCWKIQKLLLLSKPGKPPEEPSSFRPICLIDGTGKLLEKLVCIRLDRAIADAGDLSRSQFGFRKARSTVDAVNRVVKVAAQAIEGTRWKGGSKV